MDQAHLFADPATAPKKFARKPHRDPGGRFAPGPGPSPSSAEIATVDRAEFYSPVSEYEYPNLSAIIRARSKGQGIAFYDTMEGTDPDLSAFFLDLVDDVLHYPSTTKAASDDPQHKEHARFLKYALESIPNFQNVVRHFLEAYARGFSVTEKIYRVVDRGEWTGAVVFDALLDKPQRWFTFDMQRRLRFRTFQNFTPGELVPQQKFLVVTFGTNSNPYGAPVLDRVYWAWRLKHEAMKNQGLFMEKWAAPTAIAEYDWSQNSKLNEENRQKALRAIMAVQNDSALAVPKGMAVKLLESMRTGTISFEGYISQLTEMESRLVTGQILTSMGAEGGSHALGKVHEKRAANKVEMLAEFVSHVISRQIGRELIDRNFGPQDAYPVFKILAKSPVSRQADAELEAKLMANGHDISKSWSDEAFQIVTPDGPDDKLTFPPNISPSQPLPVDQNLAAPEPETLPELERVVAPIRAGLVRRFMDVLFGYPEYNPNEPRGADGKWGGGLNGGESTSKPYHPKPKKESATSHPKPTASNTEYVVYKLDDDEYSWAVRVQDPAAKGPGPVGWTTLADGVARTLQEAKQALQKYLESLGLNPAQIKSSPF